MKLEITCAVSNKMDLMEYIQKSCKSAEECGIGDNVTLKVTYYDAEAVEKYNRFFSIFGGGKQ